jgi:hypothetical protein
MVSDAGLFCSFAKTMRQRTVEQLKVMQTIAGDYVEATRALPLDANDSPRIIVYSDDRSFQSIGDAPPQFDTTCQITVMGYVTGAPLVDVEERTELLGEQIIQLIQNVAWTAPPVQRISSMHQSFEVTDVGEIYEGKTAIVFDVRWVEAVEPLLAPFSGTGLPWAYGAPFNEAVVTVENAAGETLTGATITLSPSLGV